MKAIASTQGFTLVELIVVITILAILGTIGFISIQGYSASARDSKRTSDIRALSSAITIKSTEGITMQSFVDTSTSNGITAADAFLSGSGVANGTTTTADYAAGIPAYSVFGVSPAGFKDGTNDYRVGASTRKGGVFQIAAVLENSGGTKTAAVAGNYVRRTNSGFIVTSVTLPTSAGTAFTVSFDTVAVPAVV